MGSLAKRAEADPSALSFPRAEAKGVALRPVRPGDHGFLARLYASTRAAEIAQTGWPKAVQSAFLRQQFEAQTAHYDAHYPDARRFVIEEKGQPVGRLYLEEWESQWRIIDISLMSEARGRGLGTALLQDIQNTASANTMRVSIHVESQNPAKRLYARLGFTAVEDAPTGGMYELWAWPPSIKDTSP